MQGLPNRGHLHYNQQSQQSRASKTAEITAKPLWGLDAGHGATRYGICPSGFGSLMGWAFFGVLQYFLNMNAYSVSL